MPSFPRTAALLFASLLLVAFAGHRRGEAQARPNVLFIAVDDLRPALGAFGDPTARTPNLDRLCSRGVRFERAYCQFPLCNPSRTSLLTGRFPITTGVQDNLKYFRDTQPEIETLPQAFRRAGYVTARVGKIFHGGIDDQASWVEGGEMGAARAPRAPGQQAQYRAASDRWVAQDAEETTHPDHRAASRAIELLEKHRQGPFFLALGFAKPHSPLIAPKRYFDLFESAKMPLPATFSEELRQVEGAPAGALSPNGDLFIQRRASEQDARDMIRAYHACTAFIDAQVGRVMEALDRLRLRENTIVVFFGDHGYHLGEQGKWSKHSSLYEPGTRVPIIAAGPGIRAGGRCLRTTGLIDLYPTLADLCGVQTQPGLQGHSLRPLLTDPNAAWAHPARTWARSRPGQGETLRTERYRLTVWDEGRNGVELYDYEKDPAEKRNLAADPDYAGVVAELKRQLHRPQGGGR